MIPDFTDTERWAIQSACDERWGQGEIELVPADVEIKLDPNQEGLTTCPALFWHRDGWNFVIAKTGDRRYRCQFFHSSDLDQYAPERHEFDDPADCAVTLLRAQADAVLSREAGVEGGAGPQP